MHVWRSLSVTTEGISIAVDHDSALLAPLGIEVSTSTFSAGTTE